MLLFHSVRRGKRPEFGLRNVLKYRRQNYTQSALSAFREQSFHLNTLNELYIIPTVLVTRQHMQTFFSHLDIRLNLCHSNKAFSSASICRKTI